MAIGAPSAQLIDIGFEPDECDRLTRLDPTRKSMRCAKEAYPARLGRLQIEKRTGTLLLQQQLSLTITLVNC